MPATMLTRYERNLKSMLKIYEGLNLVPFQDTHLGNTDLGPLLNHQILHVTW